MLLSPSLGYRVRDGLRGGEYGPLVTTGALFKRLRTRSLVFMCASYEIINVNSYRNKLRMNADISASTCSLHVFSETSESFQAVTL